MRSFNQFKNQKIASTTAISVFALMFIIGLIFNGCSPEQPIGPESSQDSIMDLEKGKSKFRVSLSGLNEVPPVQSGGSGLAMININERQGTITYEINVSGILLPATAAHIHNASSNSTGPVIVTLTAPDANGYSSGTILNQDLALLQEIKANPSNYYVNVHNAQYPAGAVRGQLK